MIYERLKEQDGAEQAGLLVKVAAQKRLFVIEDAAQGLMASYRGRALGTIGHLGAISFHETKNIISGEGGALFINDPALVLRAEILREKGTNRSQFFRGQVDKYTWVDLGSSYLPGEILAAFLWAQMEEADSIIQRRIALWQGYHRWLEAPESAGRLRRPFIPRECTHNGHMYYILLPSLKVRTALIEELKAHDIHTVFHYVPLHSSPAGIRYARAAGPLPMTEDIADRLVRLPLWLGLEEHQVATISALNTALDRIQ